MLHKGNEKQPINLEECFKEQTGKNIRIDREVSEALNEDQALLGKIPFDMTHDGNMGDQIRKGMRRINHR